MNQFSINALIRTFMFATLLVLGSGCAAEGPSVECTEDSQCLTGQFCDAGTCLCKTNDACGEGRYCNTWGICQPRPPCIGNNDCADGEICNSSDSSGGKCIPASKCGSSVHCDLNQFCDPQTESCQPGCRNTGDCQLGHICLAGSCVDGSSGNNCTQCPTTPDPDSSYCDYGEICTPDGQCLSHEFYNSLCQSCNSGNILANCPSNMICLLDDTLQGAEYCTPFCKTSVDCPNGYNRCNTVSVLANGQCTSDADCDGGRICIGSQEGVVAYCSCLTNADCPQTGANCLAGSCLNLGNPCTSNADCAIECTMNDLGDRGQVGTCASKAGVCGKGEGVTCNELKSGGADCTDY